MRTWLLWVGLAGCGAGEADREAEDLAAIAEDDLAWLAETALGVAAGVEGAPAGQPIEAVDDFDGVGDCTWSASWEGNPLTGSWLVALDPTPCGGETGGGLGYELDEGAFGGDWRATGAGAWTITGAGERAARLTTGSPRRPPAAYDATWTVDAVEVDVVGEGIEAWSASASYGSFGGGTWTLTFAGADGGIEGEIAGPDGATCVISGPVEAPEVTCGG